MAANDRQRPGAGRVRQSEDTFTATLKVTATSGAFFTFTSIDLWGKTADYTLEGLLGGAVLFSTSVNVPNDDWLTLNSPSGAQIDTLRISAIRDQAEYSNVDNIRLNESATLYPRACKLHLLGNDRAARCRGDSP